MSIVSIDIDLDDLDFDELCEYVDDHRPSAESDYSKEFRMIADLIKVGNKDKDYRMPTFKPTKEQRNWMVRESKKTGESYATILRRLIQEKINEKSRS